MNRRQLLFVVLLNAFVSLVIAVVVVWLADMRRPDLEDLAVQYTPPPPVVLIATPTAGAAAPAVVEAPTAVVQAVPTPTAPPVSTEEPEIYVVQQGDSLFGIALRYNLTVDQLMQANNLTNPDFVFSGQRLVIPNPNGNTGTNTDDSPQTNAAAAGLTVQVQQPGVLSDENVLIVNDSDSAVNLQGWTLGKISGSDISGPIYAFGDLPLFPGSSVRLHSETGQDDSLNLYWSRETPVWESGAVARLFNAEGREVTSFAVP